MPLMRVHVLMLVVVLTGLVGAQQPDPGATLISDHNCLACHQASASVVQRLQPKIAPRLSGVGARVTPQYLRRFIADPHGTKPGTTMPDIASTLPAGMRDQTIDALVHFLASKGGLISQDPVVADPGAFERGRQLFHQVGCFSCHKPKEATWELEYAHWAKDQISAEEREFNSREQDPFLPKGTVAPPDVVLPDLATKTTVPALAKFLQNPLHARPSGRMPSLMLDGREAHALAVYLLEGQGGQEPERMSGLKYEYYEVRVKTPELRVEGLEPVRTGSTQKIGLLKHRGDNFGFRFTGFIEIPEEDEWTFYTTSDDGSRLLIDGKLVVNNDNVHGMREKSGTIDLTEGRHAIEVTMFEVGGGEGLKVQWQGPEVKKSEIPGAAFSHFTRTYRPKGTAAFKVDPKKAALGERLFSEVGCTSCHTLSDSKIDLQATRLGPPLLELGRMGSGCLSENPTGKAVHVNGVKDAEARTAMRRDIAKTLASLRQPQSPKERLSATLHRFNCYSCHRRDDVGGPHPLRKDYHKLLIVADLGDEGRVPPELTGVGRKLHPGWLKAILFEGRRSHEFMATRMPDFGANNIRHVAEGFIASDAHKEELAPPKFSAGRAEFGRRLMGIKDGLGCIRCHKFDGRDSLGIPAVDLAPMTKRLTWGFFHDLLLDPNSVNMDTRMPKFWEGGKSAAKTILGGDPEQQIQAMWTYLHLGSAMPLPDGLVTKPGSYEVVPGQRPTMVGVFMKGVSPRTVVVGNKERVHWAFDVQNSRLAKLWRGTFFDARGTWHARAGALQSPPGTDVLDLPKGNAIAILDSPDAAWPKDVGHAAGFRVLGRRLDKNGIPAFRYALGGMTIAESGTPFLSEHGPGLRRRFAVASEPGGGAAYLRLGTGSSITETSPGRWTIAGTRPVTIALDGVLAPFVVQTDAGEELRVPLKFSGGTPYVIDAQIWW
ncbi:MAG: hypothetical protein CMJ83_06810 [Planctomycetes bacterium]|nr:hypothetical protein [Planctomycetota bacterium]